MHACRSIFCVAVVAATVACTESAPPQEQPKSSPEQVAPAPPTYDAFVTGLAGLRWKPTDERKVEGDDGKPVTNWRMTLHRGEVVKVLGNQGDWAHVKASDDSEGWLMGADLLRADAVSLATVLEPAKVFARPDFLTLDSRRTIDLGALLFVLKSKDQFSEVSYRGSSTVWVQTSDLVTAKPEVDAAKVLSKAEWLESKSDAGAGEMFALLREQFAETKLVQAYDSKMAEAGAAGQSNAPNAPPEDTAGPDEGNGE